MKCPRCGAGNGKTNKYCRNCGAHLELYAGAVVQEASTAPEPDETALGEELFGVWQDYESGELDAAMVLGEEVAGRFPESTSAQSVLALIYERKAEREILSDNVDSGRELLRKAIVAYERILAINPRSTADREKLNALRSKLAAAEPGALRRAIRKALAWIGSAPTPVVAAAITFFVVAVVLAVALAPSEKREAGGANDSTAARPVFDPGVPGNTRTTPSADDSLKVYTFQPAPAPVQPPRPSQVAAAKPPTSKKPEEVEPVKLPALGSELTLVPEPKKPNKTPAQQPASVRVGPADKPSGPVETSRIDGASSLARAIQLHEKGMVSEAIDSARQAIDLFSADISAGRNTDSARRGVANARKLIGLWQQDESAD